MSLLTESSDSAQIKREKPRLGRGIAALISDASSEESQSELDIASIHPNSNQPRVSFSAEPLKELIDSIASVGLIQPIIVRPLGENNYEIIAGERRWRACRELKFRTIPAIIKDVDKHTAIKMSIIENVQREDLTVIEEAESYKKLVEEYNYTHAEVAKIIGVSRSYISNILRILSLSPEVKEMINSKKFSMGHARALVSTENPEELINAISLNNLSVRATEKLAKNLKKPRSNLIPQPLDQEELKSTNNKTEEIMKLESVLSELLELKVELCSTDHENGCLMIKFDNFQQLDRLLQQLIKNKS